MKNVLIIGAAIALSTAGISCSAENNQPQKKTAPTVPVNHSLREDCNEIAANIYEKVCRQYDESPEKITHLRDTAVEWITAKRIMALTIGNNLLELPTYSVLVHPEECDYDEDPTKLPIRPSGVFTPHKLPDGRILLLDIESDGLGTDPSFVVDDNPESKLIEVDPVEALRLCMASKITSPTETKPPQYNGKRQ